MDGCKAKTGWLAARKSASHYKADLENDLCMFKLIYLCKLLNSLAYVCHLVVAALFMAAHL